MINKKENQIQIAENRLKENIDIKTISKVSGLTEEKIKLLQKEAEKV